jgi:nucleoside 2-deoxyribosyltransferase
MKTTTYLCGGINGLSDADCRDWRESAKSLLQTDTLDPMRRDYRGREDESVNEIVHGDYADIDASDFVLANVIRPSWGTAMEIHYAFTRGIPVIGWSGDAARISPWLRYHCVALHSALGAAIEDINARNKVAVERLKVSVR